MALISNAARRLGAALMASGGAALVGFIQAGVGAIFRTLQEKMYESVRVADYGTDAAALKKAAARLHTLGGGELLMEAGRNYVVDWAVEGDTFLTFTDLFGVKIKSNGARITCQNSAGQTKVILRASGCNGFEIDGGLRVNGSLVALSSANGGEIFINLVNGTKNVTLNKITASLIYRFFGANSMNGRLDSAVREAVRCKNISMDGIELDTVYYGFYFHSSGDNVTIKNCVARNTGRVYYPVNVSNHEVVIDGAHGGPFSDCLISSQADSAYSVAENTVSNIALNYSTQGRYPGSGNQSAFEALVAFDLDITSAAAAICTMKDINVNINADSSAIDKPANLVTFRKYYNNGAGIVVDNIGGRGHFLKCVNISGQANNWQNATERGIVLFANNGGMNWTGDKINGVAVKDFNLTGLPPSDGILVNGAGGVATTQTFWLENITSDGPITAVNMQTANLAKQGVRAPNVNSLNHDSGFWNATLTGSTAAPTAAVVVGSTYVKHGNLVTVQCAFSNVNTAGATGNLLIAGLPYPVAVTAVGSVTASNCAVPGLGLVAIGYGGTSQVELVSPQNGGALLNAAITPTGAGRYLFLTFTYICA